MKAMWYIAMPPLYKAMPSKGKEEYLYDDKALERYRKTHKGPFTLQRYKGLGEMDAQQLWEDNPESGDPEAPSGGDRGRPYGFRGDRGAHGNGSPTQKSFYLRSCAGRGIRCLGGRVWRQVFRKYYPDRVFGDHAEILY